ncbi:rhomboid-related protein 2 isoform X2 [Hyaena hyaena]|uniref:rhomboid-related protein 2 isoform X2 n=1 Tax=Hyaena hyaena TaxID=95912 RepID=UPI00192330CC|nr:rhomboid-related protein 2 isoform X2 [Hyaena hyaena]
MAADRDLEMEGVNLNLDRDMKGELEEEKEMREDGGGKDPFKNKKVHRVVSKWMLPEKVRRTYLERANCLPPPVFIISISIAELAVFIYYAVWKPQKQWITLDTGILESPFIYSPEKREEAWRFISYMLVHAGVQHILGNLVMQLMLGIPLEMVHKGLRVGLVYLAGVIAEFSRNDPCLWNCQTTDHHPHNTPGTFPASGTLHLLFPLPGWKTLTSVLLDMGFALYRRFFIPANGSPVSFAAHIAGGFAGMSIGYTVFSCFDKALLKDPRFWIAIAAYLACVLFAVFFNIFLSPAN